MFAGLEPGARLCHGRGMETRNMKAGGCFWMAAIILGAVAGTAYQNPMAGVLIGTAVGAAIAILVWLVDRRRDRP